VGLVQNITIYEPGNPASWQDRFLAKFFDYFTNGIILRALKTGKLPLTFPWQYKGLEGSSDFIGLNYYSRQFCSRRFPSLIRAHSDAADPSLLCTGRHHWWHSWISYVKRTSELSLPPKYLKENGQKKHFSLDQVLGRQILHFAYGPTAKTTKNTHA
jgi:hypothetical protein